VNDIQLVSKGLLDRGMTEYPPWFRHEGKGVGPPLGDPGLHPVRTDGMDEEGLQRDASARCPEPSQGLQKPAPFHGDLLLGGCMQEDQADEMIEHGKDEACLLDPEHRLTVPHVHLPGGLELAQRRFRFPTLSLECRHVSARGALRLADGGSQGDLARTTPALLPLIAAFPHHK
jgi:hypothetical protein